MFAAAIGAVVMLLWNWLLPDIFGFAAINYWQALGLFVLARILFGGFGHGRRIGAGGNFHKNLIRDKWMKMTPEERKEFIHKRPWEHHRHLFAESDLGGKGNFDSQSNDRSTKENE
ncbi:MAG: hypothetical protein LBS09_01835 [Bacteroidales bacterium]|nr:hypothetical protein [Bacteroidales bacterium]